MLNFVNFLAQHHDQNGVPLTYGRIWSYEAGTTNPKELYLDKEYTSPATNPIVLNSRGEPEQQVFLGLGNYKFVYEIAELNTIGTPTGNYSIFRTLDDIQGAGTELNVSVFKTVGFIDNCTDLRTIDGNTIEEKYLYAFYYTNKTGSIAQGWFEWDSDDTSADNGGTIFKYSTNSVGSWKRILASDTINPIMFGAIEDGISGLSSAFENAIEYCKLNKLTLEVSSGEYTINGNLIFEDITVIIKDGAKFKNTLAGLVTIEFNNSTLILQSNKQVLQGNWTELWDKSTFIGELTPDFWGADGTGAADSYSAFVKMSDSGIQKANTIYFRRFYTLTAVGAPSYNVVTINDAYFHQDSFLNCQYPNTEIAKIVFNKIDGDKVAKFVLGALSFNVYRFNSTLPIRLAHDAAVSLPAQKYTDIQKAVSSEYTRPNTILWDSYTSSAQIWELPVIAMPNGGNYISNDFANAYVKIGTVGTSTAFGDIVTDKDCIVTGYGYPILGFDKVVKVSWFGVFINAVTGAQRTANQVSIEHALKTHLVAQNRSGYVDGQGLTLNTDTQITIPTSSTHEFDIRGLSVNNSTTAMFNIPNDNIVKFALCTFTGKFQTSTTSSNLTLTQCRLIGVQTGADINVVANNLQMTYCYVKANLTGQTIRFEGNYMEFYNNEMLSNNIDIVNKSFSANTLVKENLFKSPMNIINPNSSEYVGNTWRLNTPETATVYVTASNTGYVVKDFWFTNNKFVYDTSATNTYEPIQQDGTNIARTKNHKATVKDNTCNYGVRMRSTEAYVNYYSQSNALITIPVSYYPIFHVGMSVNTSDSSVPAITIDGNITSGVGSGYYIEYDFIPAPPYADNHIVGNLRVQPTTTGGSVFVYMRGYTIRACTPAGSL